MAFVRSPKFTRGEACWKGNVHVTLAHLRAYCAYSSATFTGILISSLTRTSLRWRNRGACGIPLQREWCAFFVRGHLSDTVIKSGWGHHRHGNSRGLKMDHYSVIVCDCTVCGNGRPIRHIYDVQGRTVLGMVSYVQSCVETQQARNKGPGVIMDNSKVGKDINLKNSKFQLKSLRTISINTCAWPKRTTIEVRQARA